MAIVDLDFNDSTPAPPSGRANVKWQKGGSGSNIVLSANMPNFTGDSGSGGAPGAVPAPAAGDAAAGKVLKADGTWAAPSGSGGSAAPFTSMLAPSSVTPPVLASLTWGNQAFATAVANAGGAIYMRELNTNSIPILYKVAPATPWTLKIGVVPGASSHGTLGNQAGLVCRESGSGKLIGFFGGNGAAAGALGLELQKWNSFTSYSASYVGPQSIWPSPVLWLSLTDDGINLTWGIAIDGQNFKTFWSAARNNWFTTAPDQVGIGLNPTSASEYTDGVFVHWAGV